MNFLFIMVWFWNRHKKEKPTRKKHEDKFSKLLWILNTQITFFFLFFYLEFWIRLTFDKTKHIRCDMFINYIYVWRLSDNFSNCRISNRNHSFIIKIVRSYQNNNYPSSQNISEWFCVSFYRCRSSICKKLGTLDVHIHSSSNEVFKNKMFNRLRLSP